VSSEFDRFVRWLEKKVGEDARDAFSDTVVNEFFDPVNFERLAAPDAHAIYTGWCGDTMEIYLLLDRETIRHASFMTDGCGPTLACGSMLTKMVKGMPLSQASKLEPQQLVDALDGLPEENAHCADLAVITLKRAIASRSGSSDRVDAS
jgi:nitrogen fixation NifU-like protein